jgi:hypothetical protein
MLGNKYGKTMKSRKEWKKAVINIEGAADSKSNDQLMQYISSLRLSLLKGEITREDFKSSFELALTMSKEALTHTRDIRESGTAIFFLHEGHYYLFTARHVVIDERRAAANTHSLTESDDAIYRIFFKVPSLDEFINSVVSNSPLATASLMNLGAGPDMCRAYTVSTEEEDLAIISLTAQHSSQGKFFTHVLLELGYEPCTFDDLADEPSEEGAEIYTVGFPGAISILGHLVDMPEHEKHWSSYTVTQPVFAFGRVAMMHPGLDYFWCDISAFPGNSGGPIIEDGKLVGIISQQALETVLELCKGNKHNPTEKFKTGIPFAKIIKSSLLRNMLAAQIDKDNLNNDFRSGNFR